MTIHYQPLKEKGIRAAYLARPEGNVDQVVREALGMQHVRGTNDPLHVNVHQPYILDLEGADSVIYTTPHLNLRDTTCTVKVPRKEGPIVVSIVSYIPFPATSLEAVVEVGVIGDLRKKGLEPIPSERTEIPPLMLRDS